MMSCTPHKALQRGHSKCSPGTCSIRNSKRLGSASRRHSATRRCLPSPSAAVKGSSGVILLTPVPLTQNANLLIGSRTRVSKAFGLRARSEERVKGYRTQNTVTVLQRGAKPAQERNEINGRGPPPAGRMPFMSDSILNRRSAALSELGPA